MIFTAATPEYQRAYTVEKCGRQRCAVQILGFCSFPRPFALGYSMGIVLRVLDPIHPSPLTKRLGQSQNLGQMFIIRFAGQGGVSRTWQGGVGGREGHGPAVDEKCRLVGRLRFRLP